MHKGRGTKTEKDRVRSTHAWYRGRRINKRSPPRLEKVPRPVSRLPHPPSTPFERAKKWKGRLVAWCHAPWHYLPGLLYRYLVARAGPGNSCSRGEHRRWMNKVRGTPCCRRVPPAFKMWIPRSFLRLAVALSSAHLEEGQISLRRRYSDLYIFFFFPQRWNELSARVFRVLNWSREIYSKCLLLASFLRFSS